MRIHCVYTEKHNANPFCLHAQVVKIHTQTKKVERYFVGPHRLSGEPIFAPDASAKDLAEDKGWILCMVHDGKLKCTELHVLDAQAREGFCERLFGACCGSYRRDVAVLLTHIDFTSPRTSRQGQWRCCGCARHYLLVFMACGRARSTTRPRHSWPKWMHQNLHLCLSFNVSICGSVSVYQRVVRRCKVDILSSVWCKGLMRMFRHLLVTLEYGRAHT